MEETTRLLYKAPETNVLELSNEGIICQSGALSDYDRKDEQTW